MKKYNRKGGAAVVALLVVVMIVAAGTAYLIVSGHSKIDAVTEANASASSLNSAADESLADDTTSSIADEPEEIQVVHPVTAANYEDIETKYVDLSCETAMLVNADTNEILMGMNYDKKIYPASLTKIMTVLVAVENLDDLNTKYKFTSRDMQALNGEDASVVGFAEDEEVPAKDLLYGAILPSGGDAVLGLCNLVAGSEKEFVAMMNEKAEKMGLSNTHYVDAIGLHDKNHYTTVNDLAIVMKAAYDNETVRKVLETTDYTTAKTKQNPDGITLKCVFANRTNGYYVDVNGNGADDDGAKLLGGKTGFTNEAGCTLISICEYSGSTYFCISTKSSSADMSVQDQIAIYEYYFQGGKTTAEAKAKKEAEEKAKAESEAAAKAAAESAAAASSSKAAAESSSSDSTSTQTSTQS